MTDHVATAEQVEVLAPPESRGRLDILDSVVETVARKAAASVSATRHATGLSRITTTELPHARVTVRAGTVAAVLIVGAQWPTRAAVVAGRVQEEVLRKLSEITGLTVTRVDVEVHCLPSAEQTTPRRVR